MCGFISKSFVLSYQATSLWHFASLIPRRGTACRQTCELLHLQLLIRIYSRLIYSLSLIVQINFEHHMLFGALVEISWTCYGALQIVVLLLGRPCTVVTGGLTRKLCYRKDDHAMHPIHGCPENFRDSLTTPTATIPNIFHGLLFGSTR